MRKGVAIGLGAVGAAVAAFGVAAVWFTSGAMFEHIRRRNLAAHPVADNQGHVLMVGSSFFQYWATAEQDFAPLDVVNIGVGGTRIDDWIGYLDSTVVPYHPRGLIVYAGSNDFNTDADPAAVFARLEVLLDGIAQRLPGVPVLYVGICPTIARRARWADVRRFNALARQKCESMPDFHYLESAPAILDANGGYRKQIYRRDRLHFNQQGYALWAAAVVPASKAVFAAQR
jgi:lysophospholipase L1-like esterase